MPKTSRRPFGRDVVQIEFNDKKLNNRQPVDNWQFVATKRCLVIPGVAARGVRFDNAASSVFYEVFFLEDPGLTTQHRLRFRGNVLNFLGSFPPGGSNLYWLVYANENSRERLPQFMDMRGFGVDGGGTDFGPFLKGGAELFGGTRVYDPILRGGIGQSGDGLVFDPIFKGGIVQDGVGQDFGPLDKGGATVSGVGVHFDPDDKGGAVLDGGGKPFGPPDKGGTALAGGTAPFGPPTLGGGTLAGSAVVFGPPSKGGAALDGEGTVT